MKHKMFLLFLFALLQTVKSQSTESDTVWVKKIGSEVKAVKFSPDGQFIYAAADNHKPMKIETITGNNVMEYEGFIFNYKDLAKYSLDVSPDGAQLYAGGIGSCLYIWDTESGILLDSVCTNYPKNDVFPYFKSVSVNDLYLAALVADKESPYGYIHIWNRQSKNEVKVLQVDKSNRLEFDPTGKYLAVYKLLSGENVTGTLLINTTSWTTYYDFLGQTNTVRDIAFSPDGTLLASCDWDGFIKIWDINQKKLVKEINAQGHYTYSIKMISNTKILIGNGEFEDMNLKVWDISIPALMKSVLLTLPNGISFNNENKFTVVADYKSITLLNLGSIVSVDNNISDSNVIYPNPSNGSVQIHFELKKSGQYDILIFDNLSNQIETIFQGYSEEGVHSINWIPKNLPSGVYFCRIIGENYLQSYKILLQR